MDTLLPSHETALLVVDVQPRLLGMVPPERSEHLTTRISVLIQTARQLAVPILALEQDPERHGETVPAILADLQKAGARRSVKRSFSAVREEDFLHTLNALGRRRVIVCGLQAHLGVFFTARDLVLEGFITQAPRDGVLSLHAEDEAAGLDLMRQSGVIITTVETAVLDWVGRSTHPAFSDVLRRLP